MPKITSVQLTDNSTQVLDAMQEQVALALESIGQEVEGFAKEECPVDTGRLRNSIAHSVIEKDVYVGTNVEYAPYVEYGEYKHQTGNAHFLRNSVTNHTEYYKNILESALKM